MKTIKTQVCRQLLLIVVATMFAITVRAQTKDFSGKWLLVHDKTEFGPNGETSTPFELDIYQKKDSISLKRIGKTQNGEPKVYTEVLPFNGQGVTSKIRTTAKTSMVKWNDNKASLIETANYQDDFYNKKYSAVETWSLSDNGQTLTVSRTDDGDGGHAESKAVYQKQK